MLLHKGLKMAAILYALFSSVMLGAAIVFPTFRGILFQGWLVGTNIIKLILVILLFILLLTKIKVDSIRNEWKKYERRNHI